MGGGKLILNTAFPRLMLPLESVLESFMRFLPTLAVYAVVHVAVGLPIRPRSSGRPDHRAHHGLRRRRGDVHRNSQVYFRDLASFLRYFTRIWLYTSPILFYAEDVPPSCDDSLLQPDVSDAGSLNDAVIEGRTPPSRLLAASLAWAVGPSWPAPLLHLQGA